MLEKLRRADEHRETITAVIDAHFDRYGRTAPGTIDHDGRLRFVGAADPAPRRLSVVVGDCVHNLRSSLIT